MFKKVLIANRGEVAMRIIRACRELGVRSVLAHSEADADSLPVRYADQAICIGPKEASKSYLNIPSLIAAAEVTDCDAVHPGYGFLSENAGFAEVLESCNINFIGPSVKHIQLMGDKSQAKATAKKAGVPVTPGSDGPLSGPEEALDVASKIGYPVLLKASAGGGGKGMRLVHSEDELVDSLKIVRAEAASAFGNNEIYMEKYITQPRHIEIQIIGDKHGNLVHLFERDCSIQRRHQKLLEEAPSVAVDAETRKMMGDTALRLAREIGYYNAGTVEFLYNSDGSYYFMEMNTRIQVEHPVTEMITGIDLVKEQIRVAAGKKLSFTQDDIHINGHSIECRINAEDPVTFMPSAGKVDEVYLPGGPGVRVDTALFNGYRIPPYYDSMIAKVIVLGRDREEAIARMRRAMGGFHITGIKTTIPLHVRILHTERFINGDIDTKFIEDMEI
ncbi:MAG: acetyl-CoA carboxylase biotin carboxylase subunit [Nitrospinota bacterium]|nr:acetyl-CoA carboxylase biotin carboxylase subunit [Nitrospinota bacterium]